MADALSLGTWLLRAVLAGTLLLAIRRRNVSIGANALAALAATFLPAFVEFSLEFSRGVQVPVDGLVPFWIASAGSLHVLGMFGWYESKWWWDHLTHVVSAALVAAVFYGLASGVVVASPDLQPPTGTVAGLTLLFTLAVGVFWELLELVVHRYSEELDVEAVLIPYGRRDTALDLVFDVVGAVLVVVFGVRILVPLASEVPSLSIWLLVSAAGFVVVGSLGAGLLLFLGPPGPRDGRE